MITGRSASRRRAIARSSARSSTGVRRISARLAERGLLGLGEHVVEREVDERRPGVRAARRVPRLVEQARDLRRRARGRGHLDHGPHERQVVDLLQRALAPAPRRRAAAEHEHRRAVLRRRGHRADPVRDPGPGGQRRHARLARDLRPALGGERGGGLVAHVDEVDPLRAAAVVDREQVPAGEREQLGHAVRLQAARDQPAAVEGLGRFGLGRHGAGIYPRRSGGVPPGRAGSRVRASL